MKQRKIKLCTWIHVQRYRSADPWPKHQQMLQQTMKIRSKTFVDMSMKFKSSNLQKDPAQVGETLRQRCLYVSVGTKHFNLFRTAPSNAVYLGRCSSEDWFWNTIVLGGGGGLRHQHMSRPFVTPQLHRQGPHFGVITVETSPAEPGGWSVKWHRCWLGS